MTRLVAGHVISDRDGRCERCNRSVNDVMSDAEGAKLGDFGVACSGVLVPHEMHQIEEERARRARIWGEVVGVSS